VDILAKYMHRMVTLRGLRGALSDPPTP
jgi:hypothetical protein